MTIREGFDRIYETFSLKDGLDQTLEQFKEICQDSPLNNQQEDSLITAYERHLKEMEDIHFILRTAYLEWVIKARES